MFIALIWCLAKIIQKRELEHLISHDGFHGFGHCVTKTTMREVVDLTIGYMRVFFARPNAILNIHLAIFLRSLWKLVFDKDLKVNLHHKTRKKEKVINSDQVCDELLPASISQPCINPFYFFKKDKCDF